MQYRHPASSIKEEVKNKNTGVFQRKGEVGTGYERKSLNYYL